MLNLKYRLLLALLLTLLIFGTTVFGQSAHSKTTSTDHSTVKNKTFFDN